MAEYMISDERLAELNRQGRAMQEIEDAGGLCAILRNGHPDATVMVDARRTAADEIEWLRTELNKTREAIALHGHVA